MKILNTILDLISNLFKREKEHTIVDHIELIDEKNPVNDALNDTLNDTPTEGINGGVSEGVKIPSQEDENKSIDEIVHVIEESKKDFHYIFQQELPKKVINELPLVIEKFNISNNLRLAHFLGQTSHESGFKNVYENLNYSEQGLANTWPTRYAIRDERGKVIKPYKPNEVAIFLASQPRDIKPEMIANYSYANRGGNGDIESGEGFKYRGRGYLQTTLKDNYKLLNKIVEEDIVKDPDLVATKYPLLSAGFYFNSNRLWAICDRGVDIPTITFLTQKINGGKIGLKHRVLETIKFYNILENK